MFRPTQQSFYSVIVFLLISLCAGSIWAEYNGTIVTKSGESYAGVEFTVNRAYKVIEVILDTGKKNISFDQIKSIIDAEGNDITEAVLEDYYKPQKNETWKSETSPAVSKYKTKLWNAGFRIAATHNLPIGDYYDGIKSGIGFEGSFLIAVTNQIDIKLTFSKTGLNTEDIWKPLEIDAKRYVIECLYHKRMLDMTPGRTYPFAETGLGAVQHDFTLGDRSTGETDFMWTLGGGLWVMLSQKMALDFSGGFDFVVAGTQEDSIGMNEVVYGYIFNLNAGILIFL